MADRAPLKATFFAFQKREPGGVLLKATIAYLVVALAMGVLFLGLNWSALGPVGSWYMSVLQIKPGETPDFPQPPGELLGIIPSYLLVIIGSFILLAAYEAACLRWLVRDETEGFFGLSLGADTWRVWAGYWVWMFMMIVAYAASFAVILAITIGGGFILGQAGGALGNGGGIIAGLFVFVTVILAYLAPTYVATRYAPAAATSIALRKFSFFKAWDVSRKRFWALFGAFFLLIVIFMVAYIFLYGATAFTILGAAVGDIAAANGPNSLLPETIIAALTTPTGVATIAAFYVAMMAASMAFYVALFGVNARAVLAALEEGKIAPEALMPPSSAGL